MELHGTEQIVNEVSDPNQMLESYIQRNKETRDLKALLNHHLGTKFKTLTS